MKILVGFMIDKNQDYKMFIKDADEININKSIKDKWLKIDVNQLAECNNIKINIKQFKSDKQNPSEYLEASFDINKLIFQERNKLYYQITNVYYDNNDCPQLYRTTDSNGYVYMHDISEYDYRKHGNLYDTAISNLPDYVKREPLINAYNWWKIQETSENISNIRWLNGKFETCEDTPVKLLYHYLIGVKNFKEGFHVTTEEKDNHYSEIRHEYLLYNGTATIKLTESIPMLQDKFYTYERDSFGREKDPYPDKRKIKYYGANMSIVCYQKEYSQLDIHNENKQSIEYEKKYFEVDLDYRDGLIDNYNKIEQDKSIQKDWNFINADRFFNINNFIPNELSLMSCRLQSEKDNTPYRHVMCCSHSYWSVYKTDNWMKIIGLILSIQYYNKELKQLITPIINSYQNHYNQELSLLIQEIGANDALEVLKWTKNTSYEIFNIISYIQNDNNILKSNKSIIDEIEDLFTFKRNNYDLPEWLQIYAPNTIESLGNTALIKATINSNDNKSIKESLSYLATHIEKEKKYDSQEIYKQIISAKNNINNDINLTDTEIRYKHN